MLKKLALMYISIKITGIKIKSSNRKINTNSQGNKIPKQGSHFICLLRILIDSVFRTGKNYYPQVFLEECKYVIKEKMINKYITGDAEISDYDQDSSDDEILEKITIKKNSDEEDSSEEDSSEEDSFYTQTNVIKIYLNKEEIII